MSRIIDQDDPWDGWMETWQAQATTPPDVEALRQEVSRRSRRLRALRIGELLVAAVALGNCLRALLLKGAHPIPGAVLLGLMGVVIGYTLWVQWQRRRQWQARELDPPALVAFEIARTLTSIRIWRVSTWASLALWVALTVWGIGAMSAGPAADALPPAVWALNIGVNALVVLVSAGLGFWIGRRRRRRLARLDAMRRVLDPE
jgi:hypothetical protein